MNLANINKRLEQLEVNAPSQDAVTLLYFSDIPPTKTDKGSKQDLPVRGIACMVVNGDWFSRKDYPSKQEYIDAVNKEHIRVHGKPCEDFEVTQ